MPDYIPRSDALEAIEAERKAAHWTAQNEPSIESIHDECIITRTLERVEMRIRNIPPDSVKPVTHGEWVGNFPNPNYARCTVCKNAGMRWQKYCPNCGAKMKEAT